MFCYFAVNLGTVIEHEQKFVKTELLKTQIIRAIKNLNVFLFNFIINKLWQKNHGNAMILTDLEQENRVSFKHKVSSPLSNKIFSTA